MSGKTPRIARNKFIRTAAAAAPARRGLGGGFVGDEIESVVRARG